MVQRRQRAAPVPPPPSACPLGTKVGSPGPRDPGATALLMVPSALPDQLSGPVLPPDRAWSSRRRWLCSHLDHVLRVASRRRKTEHAVHVDLIRAVPVERRFPGAGSTAARAAALLPCPGDQALLSAPDEECGVGGPLHKHESLANPDSPSRSETSMKRRSRGQWLRPGVAAGRSPGSRLRARPVRALWRSIGVVADQVGWQRGEERGGRKRVAGGIVHEALERIRGSRRVAAH